MAFLLFVLILSIVVLAHEFGHFFAAKKTGVRVEEFGLGLPPRIWGKKFGETLYSINLLPFGGFNKLTGEDLVEGEGEDAIKDDPHSFAVKSPLQRGIILIAGVFMNMALAVAIFYVILASNNFESFKLPLFFDYEFKFGQANIMGTVVSDIMQDSPAANSGVALGEALVSINGEDVNNTSDVRRVLESYYGESVEVKLIDLTDQTKQTYRLLNITPAFDDDGCPYLGVYLTEAVSLSYQKPLEKTFAGFLHAYNMLDYSIDALSEIFAFSIETKDISPVSQSVSGPVGIYNVVKVLVDQGGISVWKTILDYMALMSLSLAFINMLPLPALDGGRFLLVVIEGVFKKKLSPKVEARIHQIGMMFLLTLLVLITVKDLII